MRIASAAVLYFLAVFGAGFALGPIRVLWLEPRLGVVAATLCEAPFLLLAMIAAAYWIPRIIRILAGTGTMLAIGVGALALQQAADLVVGTAPCAGSARRSNGRGWQARRGRSMPPSSSCSR